MTSLIDKELFDELWRSAIDAKNKRAEDMPTEKDAIEAMFQCYLRLKELGWNDASYCPKDGSKFKVVESGSSGIHDCHYDGKWPNGIYWVHDAGDLWPSRPVLYKKDD